LAFDGAQQVPQAIELGGNQFADLCVVVEDAHQKIPACCAVFGV